MQLHVRVIEAEGLPKMDVFGSVDPYCQLQVNTVQKVERTKTIKNCKHPVWNEEFHFPVHDISTDTLYLLLKDYDRVSNDDPISKAKIPIYTLKMSQVVDEWITMIPVKNVKKGGKLRVVLHLGKLNEKPFHPDQTFDEKVLNFDHSKSQINQTQQNYAGQMINNSIIHSNQTQQNYAGHTINNYANQQYSVNQMQQIPMQHYSSNQMNPQMQQCQFGQMMQMPVQHYTMQHYSPNQMMNAQGQTMMFPAQQYSTYQMPMQQYYQGQMIQAPMQQYQYDQVMNQGYY